MGIPSETKRYEVYCACGCKQLVALLDFPTSTPDSVVQDKLREYVHSDCNRRLGEEAANKEAEKKG